jgi:CDP-diacylglycerol--serine O-phosphatidyltransferase
MANDNRKPIDLRRRSIYLLPNLFTTAALFAGFYAIVQAMNGKFEHSAVAIFIAMVLDGLDGRVARLTRTQSEFGAEYDSLSDMVSFGVAPALIVYEWALKGLGKWGWFAAFIYCAGTALRLARFNTNIDVVDKSYFQGLPSPAAAALIAGFIWVLLDNHISGEDARWFACALTVFAGFSMVSNLPYYSFKAINMRKSVPFIVIFLFALFFIFISVDPPSILFLLFLCYSLSGYVMYLLKMRRKSAGAPTGEPLPKQD